LSDKTVYRPTTEEEDAMRPIVDHDTCIGCELCAETCPAVFEIRDDGYSWVIDEDPPPERHDCVRESVEICPTSSITVEE
jgi:ferredoxin